MGARGEELLNEDAIIGYSGQQFTHSSIIEEAQAQSLHMEENISTEVSCNAFCHAGYQFGTKAEYEAAQEEYDNQDSCCVDTEPDVPVWYGLVENISDNLCRQEIQKGTDAREKHSSAKMAPERLQVARKIPEGGFLRRCSIAFFHSYASFSFALKSSMQWLRLQRSHNYTASTCSSAAFL